MGHRFLNLLVGAALLSACAEGDDKRLDGSIKDIPVTDAGQDVADDVGWPDIPQGDLPQTSDLPPSPDQPPPPPPVDGGAASIVVTEIIPNPGAVSDGAGEWIELHNAGSSSVDLDGWTLKDDGSDLHVIKGPLVIAAGQYLVLGADDQTATNGGVTVGYKYAKFFLSNSADEVVLLDTAGTVVDRVAWTTAWGITSGASLQLRSVSLDNNVAANWCVAATAWSGSAGDFGTPGAANSCPQPDGGTPDAGPDAGPPDVGPAPDGPIADLGPAPDMPVADGMVGPPTCPPVGSTPSNPATGLGDLDGQTCNYVCWGSGTIYNLCATDYWQFCLPQGVFAPCQQMPPP